MSAARARSKAGRRAGRPGLAYVIEVFSRLYPGASVAVRRAPGGRFAHAWAILPAPRDPWLIVPTKPPAAARAALDELKKRNYPTASRLAGLLVSTGVLDLSPRLTVSRGEPEDIQDVIARILNRPVSLSMVVGRVRALQKPVMRVLGENGSTLGYAKIGVSTVTNALVRHEAGVLRSFETDPPKHFNPPAVLGIEEWQGLFILIQEPVNATLAPETSVVRRAAVEISYRGTTEAGALGDSVGWQFLKRRVHELPEEGAFTSLLIGVIEDVEDAAADTLVQFGWWHGDFAPWNMAWDGAALSVWDWEGFAGSVPVGFDILHYYFQGDVVIRGRHPEAAFRDLVDAAADLLAPWDPPDPDLVVMLYLIYLVTGLIETDDRQTRISRLEDWLAPALAAHLTRLRERG